MNPKFIRLPAIALALFLMASSALAANLSSTTSLSISNQAPAFTAGPSDNGSSAATPTNAGQNVTLTATATDPNGDQWYLAVCKTDSVSAGSNAAPTCPGGSWAVSPSPLASGSQATLTYTTQNSDPESNDWYAFACDKVQGTGLCSAASQGGGTVTTAIGSENDFANATVLQADGKIIEAGYTTNGGQYDFALARHNTNGTIDSSFGTHGKVTTGFSGMAYSLPYGIALQSDGKIVESGSCFNGSVWFFCIARFNPDGSLDPSFGSGGKVTEQINGNSSFGESVTIQSDKKIVVVGSATISGLNRFALLRLNQNGTPDSGFGAGGMVTTAIGSTNDAAYAIALQGDGKIVAAGNSNNGTNLDFALARYNTDGSLDSTFGTGGKVTTDFSGDDYIPTGGVAVQSDGKIVAAGNTHNTDFALARYNTDGSLDSTFGMGGKVTTAIGLHAGGLGVILQADGKPVVVGFSYDGSTHHFALARYNTDGSLDSGFGTNGMTTTLIGQDSSGYGLALQADGKLVATGDSDNGSNTNFALTRYNTDGTLDQGFGPNGSPFYVNHAPSLGTVAIGPTCGSTATIDPGNSRSAKVTSAYGSGDTWLNSVTTQSDGKIVAAGNSYNGSSYVFFIARYNSDLTPDTSFGTGGTVTLLPGGADAWGSQVSVAIQPTDQKIVVAGRAYISGGFDFAVARFNTDGSPDTSFGTGGKVITNVANHYNQANAVAIQSDGKIVAVGTAGNGSNEDFAVVRYNTDGSLDTSFNGTGKVMTSIGDGDEEAWGMALQSDGKIVAAGFSNNGSSKDFAAVRYNANGSLDTTFNSTGKVTTSFGSGDDQAWGVAIQSDRKIVAAGQGYNGSNLDAAVVRYNTDGSLDTSFNGTGKVMTSIGDGDDEFSGVAIQPDGKIVGAGSGGFGSNYYFAAVRYDTNGSLDSSYGTGGITTTVFGGTDDVADAAILQSDGKMISAGYSLHDIALVRYTSSGALDDLSGYGCAQAAVTDPDANAASSLVDVHVCSTDSFSNGACTGTELCSIKGARSGDSAQCVINGLVPIPTMHGTYPAYVFTVDSNGFQGTGSPTESYAVTDTPPYISDASDYSVSDITLTAGQSTAKTYTVTVKDDNGDTDLVNSATGYLYNGSAIFTDGACPPHENNCYESTPCSLSGNTDYSGPGLGMPASNEATATCDLTVWFNTRAGSNWFFHVNPADGNGNNSDSPDSNGIQVFPLQALNVSTPSNAIAYGTIVLGGTSDGKAITLQNYGNQVMDVLVQGTDMTRTGGGSIDHANQRWSNTAQDFNYADGNILTDNASGATTKALGCADLNLSVRSDHASSIGSDQPLFWKLMIPSTLTAGTYSGTDTLISAANDQCSDNPGACVSTPFCDSVCGHFGTGYSADGGATCYSDSSCSNNCVQE
jgi:uncharacterized delta-60 repeat protein